MAPVALQAPGLASALQVPCKCLVNPETLLRLPEPPRTIAATPGSEPVRRENRGRPRPGVSEIASRGVPEWLMRMSVVEIRDVRMDVDHRFVRVRVRMAM